MLGQALKQNGRFWSSQINPNTSLGWSLLPAKILTLSNATDFESTEAIKEGSSKFGPGFKVSPNMRSYYSKKELPTPIPLDVECFAGQMIGRVINSIL